MSLSVCLVTRNEERSIGRALGSVAGLAHEMIVVDTGSIDGTVGKAEKGGARVYQTPWNDDFGEAQNVALARATGDWIIWMNPDEELMPGSGSMLLSCLQRAEAFAYRIRVQEQTKAEQLDNLAETMQLRLYRRRSDMKYVGRCHPHFVTSPELLAHLEGKQVGLANVMLRRHAYLSELTPAKIQWATRLLSLELQDRPGQLFYLIEYGLNLLRLQDDSGHRVLAEAAEQVNKARGAPEPPTAATQRLLEYLITVRPEQSQSVLSAEDARELGRRWFPTSPPLVWLDAIQYFRQEDFEKAAELLQRLAEFGRNGLYDKSSSFDPSIIGSATLMNLGACFTRMRRLDKAEACFRRLVDNAETRTEAQRNLAVVANLRLQSNADTSAMTASRPS